MIVIATDPRLRLLRPIETWLWFRDTISYRSKSSTLPAFHPPGRLDRPLEHHVTAASVAIVSCVCQHLFIRIPSRDFLVDDASLTVELRRPKSLDVGVVGVPNPSNNQPK